MKDYDFICIGGGLGGLAGAVRAQALGMTALVIEKTQFAGGVAAYSGGDVWAPLNHLARAQGLEQDRAAAFEYMGYVGGIGVPYSAELRETYIDRIGEAVQFFTEQAALDFRITRLSDSFYPVSPGSVAEGRSIECATWGDELGDWLDRLRPAAYHNTVLRWSEALPDATPLADDELREREERHYLVRGRGLVGALLKSALTAGVDIVLDAPALSLLYDGQRVTGVKARIDGEDVDIAARRGVLIATGGYGYASFAAELEGLPEYGEQAPPIVHGDAFKLIEPTPATIVRAGFGYISLGYQSATLVHPGTDVPMTVPIVGSIARSHCIAVNPDAHRFGDESNYLTFTSLIGSFDGLRKRYANFPTYAILDDQFRQCGQEFGLGKGSQWPEKELVKADTLEELAMQLGLPPVQLVETVERFNEFCRRGVDEDFHRGEAPGQFHVYEEDRIAATLGTIEQAPFWGVRCSVAGAGINSHGLSINRNAAVCGITGAPVEGLYATGNAVAYTEMPGGYSGGVANGRNLTYAYVAATHAAGASHNPG